MNIGDRVRLLHAKEEGIVVNVKGNIIEIEIEDGFVIPAAKNEVVLVSKEEAMRFHKPGDTPQNEEKKNQIFAEAGMFLVLVPSSATTYELHLVNNTDYTLAITLFQDLKNKFRGVFKGVLGSKTSAFSSNISLSENDLSEYIFQGLYFLDQIPKIKEPLIKKIKLKPYLISNELKKAPIINKPGYLIQIDSDQIPVNAKLIKESLEEGPSKPIPAQIFKSPGKEVDLHIEKLTEEWNGLSNTQILDIQLSTFENTLDRAIAAGQDEIKYVHGLGNGVLRSEIQKRLSKMKNIKYYEDSMKGRFGFGATIVKIK